MIRERLWEALSGLPPAVQESVVDLGLGIIAPTAMGHMLARAFVCFGADPQEVEATLRHSRSFTDLAGRFADLGEWWEEQGEQAKGQGHRATAREAYRRAALYYGVEAWAAVRPGHLRDAYVDLGRCYEAYRRLANTPIERVEIPYGDTALPGYLRLPTGRRAVPCVVLVQGFDTIKEWMAPIAAVAVERGMATLSVDIPGNGEALARGFPLASPKEAEAVAEAICDFLSAHPRVQSNRLAVFGFSIGGFLALVMASAADRLGACATLGAPFDFGFLDRCSPLMARRATFATGSDSVETIRREMAALDLRPYLSRLRGPLLVVHGDDDEIVPVRHAELVHHYAHCVKALKVFENADHLVSRLLRTQALPLVFDWLGDELLHRER